ncbi:membrane protein, partial [Streptomyces leeuwenhoekii]
AIGLAVAVRAGRTARTLVPLACAATAALPYLFTIEYAAPRFLQPAYALLAIPVADALWHLVRTPAGRWRPWPAALVAVALAGHLAVQLTVLVHTVDRNTDSRRDWARTAATLHRLGVRPPCLLT